MNDYYVPFILLAAMIASIGQTLQLKSERQRADENSKMVDRVLDTCKRWEALYDSEHGK